MEIKPKMMTLAELETIELGQKKVEEKKQLQAIGNLKKPQTLKRDRYYLPVLHLNDPTQWPVNPNKTPFSDTVAHNVCLGNCCGVKGVYSACCQMDMDDLEHVLGPVDEKWIEGTIAWFKKKGIQTTRADLVIDFDEGKLIGERFFQGERKQVFFSKETYPILRFQVNGPRFACKFLNVVNGKCQIYEQRPGMCRGYLCQYVKANFLVKTDPVNHPNIYNKVR
ncbi:MAG: hypothetical protein E6R04_01010 [Spirochaetes bacterium]|nr:MAG: hypothetical protein E6R04_01010 [Spirochaetota bacterium]